MKRKYSFIVKSEDLLQEFCESRVMGYEIGPIELKDDSVLSEVSLFESVKFDGANAIQLKKLANGFSLIEVLEKFITKKSLSAEDKKQEE